MDKDTQRSSSKSDGKFYDVDFDYQEIEAKKIANQHDTAPSETTNDTDDTSLPLSRSLQKMKSIFQQAATSNEIPHNPYHKESQQTDFENRSPLPSREAIRAERERRRKLRIDELEKLSSPQEVEKTHIHRNAYQTAHDEENHVPVETTPVVFPTETEIINEPPIIEEQLPSDVQITSDEEVVDETNVENVPVIPNKSIESDIIDDPNIEEESPVEELAGTADFTDEPTDGIPLVIEQHSDELKDDELTIVPVPPVVTPPDSSNTQKRSNKKQKTRKAKNKKPKQAIYSLQELSKREKIAFAFNVFFNVLKKFALYLILIGTLLGALGGGIGLGYFAYLVSQTPPPTREAMAEQINRVEQQSTLYYADGSPIANVRADIVRNVAELKDVSQYIIDGLVATEDELFYEHPGVVPKAILRATLQELISSGSGTGGSTLTQQLVKQQLLTNDVTFFRKANEILLALRVENYFSKDEILAAYLNISPFGRNNNGENVAGILSASTGLFGKQPSEVNLAQAAFLVGLPQDPYTYTPYNQYGEISDDLTAGINRMKEVLFRMYRTEKITKEEYEAAINYDIAKDFLPTEHKSVQRQTYLYQAMMNGAIEQIMRLLITDQGLTWDQVNADVDWYNEFYYKAMEQLRTGGYHVYTTIDKNIYDLLQQSATANKGNLGISHDGIYTNEETGEETYFVENVESGVVVIDNATGKVLGFVSGTDYENNQIDHAFGMRRSPGSTIKPLAVYGPAIEYNMINPSTVIPDTAFVKTFEDGSTWTPTNYGGAVSGTMMTARTALLRSDNLPAVRIYEKILENNIPVFDFLKKMGFDINDSYTESDTLNLAFALGGVTTGPTVFEQTSAFTTFANNGQYIDGYYIERIEDAFGNIVYQHESAPVQVFAEDTNYLMVDMLRNTNTLGTGRTAAANLITGGDWIAKSGISENSRDIWYIASTPALTIGTWIGYDNRYYDYYIDINDGYGRESERIQIYWANLVNDLYNSYPELLGVERQFNLPDSIVKTPVVQTTGTLPGSINVNGTVVKVDGPLVEEVFKMTNPAPVLSTQFLFNASEQDVNNFWAAQVAQAQEALRKQREAQQQTTTQQGETTVAPTETTSAPPPTATESSQPVASEAPPASE